MGPTDITLPTESDEQDELAFAFPERMDRECQTPFAKVPRSGRLTTVLIGDTNVLAEPVDVAAGDEIIFRFTDNRVIICPQGAWPVDV